MAKICFHVFVLTCWLGAVSSVCRDPDHKICNIDALVNSPRLKIRGCTNFTISSSSICVVECERYYLPKPSALSFCVNGYFTEIRCVFIDIVVEMCEDEKNYCPYKRKDFAELRDHHNYPEKVLLFRQKRSFIPIKVIPPDKDINECDPETPFHDCVAMATCKNTDESFTCVCPNGFGGNGRTYGSGCSDINECDANTPAHDCVAMATCNNNIGSFACTCPNGFAGNGSTSGNGCAVFNSTDSPLNNSLPTSTESPPNNSLPSSTANLSQNLSCNTIPSQYLPEDVVYPLFFNPVPSQPNILQISNDSRITADPGTIRGKPTSIANYPWQGALFLQNEGFVCGATIILSKWILSTAYCMNMKDNLTEWFAYFGVTALSQRSDGEWRSIINVIFNRNYFQAAFGFDYDISLLELDRVLPYTRLIKPICVPPPEFSFPDGMQCYISGWGITGDLQHSQVDVIGNERCNQPDWLDNLVTDRMLCAGSIEGGIDTCLGDNGGPLSCYVAEKKIWMVAGIVSWGIECGLPKFPGVYTNISFFTEWIWTNIARAEGILPTEPEEPEISESSGGRGGSAYNDKIIEENSGSANISRHAATRQMRN